MSSPHQGRLRLQNCELRCRQRRRQQNHQQTIARALGRCGSAPGRMENASQNRPLADCFGREAGERLMYPMFWPNTSFLPPITIAAVRRHPIPSWAFNNATCKGYLLASIFTLQSKSARMPARNQNMQAIIVLVSPRLRWHGFR